jgi:hypothetical protein
MSLNSTQITDILFFGGYAAIFRSLKIIKPAYSGLYQNGLETKR